MEGGLNPKSCNKQNETKKTLPGRFQTFLGKIYKVISSWLGLLILLATYSVIGAAIFRAIESPNEQRKKIQVVEEREVIIAELWNLTQIYNETVSKEMWIQFVNSQFPAYEKRIYDTMKHGFSTEQNEEIWDFYGALLFCETVYTTIGYGHFTAKTSWGRVATIIYAIIGIPLAMLVLADVGKRLTMILKFVWAFVRRWYFTGYCRKVRTPFMKKYEVSTGKAREEEGKEETDGVRTLYGYEIDDEFNLPVTIALIVLVVYIFLGAFMYTFWERWDYLDAFYFVFVSLSTIGFGDIIPEHPKFFLLSSIYIFVGLSLVSMCINVAIEFFTKTIVKAKETFDETLDKARETATKTMDQFSLKGKSNLITRRIPAELEDEEIPAEKRDSTTNIMAEAEWNKCEESGGSSAAQRQMSKPNGKVE